MDRDEEIDRNYEAFQKALPRLLKEHEGKYVLIHKSVNVGTFGSAREALRAGQHRFGNEVFSVQLIAPPTDMGFISHGIHIWAGA